MKQRLLIIDGNALVHRAFHALPRLTTKKGEVVNAVYGFLSIFFKTIKKFQPEFICTCFDLAGPTFRHQQFSDYKATRPKAPDELYEQIPKIKQFLRVLKVPIFERQGFEADDLIATISKNPEVEKIETIILSGDLDTLQLVDDNTKVFTLRKGMKDTVLYNEQAVLERFDLPPALVTDLKGLMGDSSDNIPGIPGIGQKTASRLLKSFGSLENLYQEIEKNGDKVKEIKPRIKALLEENKEQAFFSKMLAQVRQDVPTDFNLKSCRWKDFDREKVISLLKDFEFFTLIDRLSLLMDSVDRKEEAGSAQSRPDEQKKQGNLW